MATVVTDPLQNSKCRRYFDSQPEPVFPPVRTCFQMYDTENASFGNKDNGTCRHTEKLPGFHTRTPDLFYRNKQDNHNLFRQNRPNRLRNWWATDHDTTTIYLWWKKLLRFCPEHFSAVHSNHIPRFSFGNCLHKDCTGYHRNVRVPLLAAPIFAGSGREHLKRFSGLELNGTGYNPGTNPIPLKQTKMFSYKCCINPLVARIKRCMEKRKTDCIYFK